MNSTYWYYVIEIHVAPGGYITESCVIHSFGDKFPLIDALNSAKYLGKKQYSEIESVRIVEHIEIDKEAFDEFKQRMGNNV